MKFLKNRIFETHYNNADIINKNSNNYTNTNISHIFEMEYHSTFPSAQL